MFVRKTGIIIAAGLFALGCADDPEATDDLVPGKDEQSGVAEKIVGGQIESGYPAVGVVYGQGVCTGTLITPEWILTAAHCIGGNQYFVTGPSLNNYTNAYPIVQEVRHPQYNSRELTHDIALVRIGQPAAEQPMPILTDRANLTGESAFFVGYGITLGGRSDSGVKRSVSISITEDSGTQFAYSTPGRNTCNGDSGGPAFVQRGGVEMVAGVTSYGDQGCTQYGVDTNVAGYLAWIEGYVGAMAPQPQPQPEPEAPAEPESEPESNLPPQSGDDCGDIDYDGICVGDTSVWCGRDGLILEEDCAADGRTCGDAGPLGNYCIAAVNPCDNLDYYGACDGDSAVWCDDNVFKQYDCAGQGLRCGWTGRRYGYWCRR